jgi:hypothetical protein
MFKYSLIYFLLTTSTLSSFSQNSKQKDFEKTVKALVMAFEKEDIKTINSYIDKSTGLFLLYRSGVFDQYIKLEGVPLVDTSYPHVLVKNHIKFTSIKYQKLPTINCDNGKWSKAGLFIDTTKTFNTLSEICKMQNKYLHTDTPDEKIPAKEIKAYKLLEQKSRRIICCTRKIFDDLIFHLMYKNGKWFLWLIDKVASDCSA